MICKICRENAVFSSPNYCNKHFISYFERKVRDTIKKFALLSKKDNIAVAVSGGKDSMSLLYVLTKFEYRVTALAIDEGISGYRDRSLLHMKKFCHENNIPFKIASFEREFGHGLDRIVKKREMLPCSVCGVFRRRLLNIHSASFDVLATGHNMDDECQAIMMNLLKTNVSLLSRLGPIAGGKRRKEFTKRVKPFYLCSEKEIMVYAYLNKLNGGFEECPYVGLSFRLKVRDMLNDIEQKKSGTKKNIVELFLNLKFKSKETENKEKRCIYCRELSSNGVCGPCAFLKNLKSTTI